MGVTDGVRIAGIMEKMIGFSRGSLHDIDHFIKVWGCARTIGVSENLDPETLETLEAAAIVHDIACPILRERLGSCPGAEQETEGMPMARALLRDTGLTPAQLERAVFLVGHHHTVRDVDGPDWRILLEADFLVNAGESGYGADRIAGARETIFETRTGRALLDAVYGI